SRSAPADYVGRGANGVYPLLIEPALRTGRTAWVTGHPDMPHTFTVNADMARALVVLAGDERAWGRAWHVPSPPDVTLRELARRYAVAAGRPPVRLVGLPRFAMRVAGLVVPIAREVAEMDYRWYAPFHVDAAETARTFGLTATDLDTAVRAEVG
ncbi:NAD-dependent epimerase, partial [Lentzea sp. NPDC060358]